MSLARSSGDGRAPIGRCSRGRSSLAAFPIDHTAAPAPDRGGRAPPRRSSPPFVERKLAHYGDERNDPDADVVSGLSPYLHFGHLSAHEAVAQVLRRERWSVRKRECTPRGARTGWWGVSASAEALLDRVVTWRELGFNMSARRPDDVERYESLPAWALATLERQAGDPRPYTYTLDQFAAAATHDALWTAAQRQLATEGRIHEDLRMLWGKKILEWTVSPREALV